MTPNNFKMFSEKNSTPLPPVICYPLLFNFTKYTLQKERLLSKAKQKGKATQKAFFSNNMKIEVQGT